MRRRVIARCGDIHMYILLFSTFINFTLPASCNVHRSRAHPSWMTAPIQGRRFYVSIVTPFPSPVAARDLLVCELSATCDTRVEALSIVCDCAIMVSGHQSDVGGGALCCSKPQDDILISFVDWTLAIIDPLKSSGLSPGKRPGSFSVSRNASESPVDV